MKYHNYKQLVHTPRDEPLGGSNQIPLPCQQHHQLSNQSTESLQLEWPEQPALQVRLPISDSSTNLVCPTRVSISSLAFCMILGLFTSSDNAHSIVKADVSDPAANISWKLKFMMNAFMFSLVNLNSELSSSDISSNMSISSAVSVISFLISSASLSSLSEHVFPISILDMTLNSFATSGVEATTQRTEPRSITVREFVESLVRYWTEKVKVSDYWKGHWTRGKAKFGPSFGKYGSDQHGGDNPHQEKYDVALKICHG
ncbi:hypothetical protein G4B88_020708 [Cannabis sativa]|uniref:Uncharacterized protein n=1 Tax=Cannabis sativa TaxID=3483 RepID=A0A7J6HM59_CANSA|nr:hypothetical protein G4B88_020708 [Cannabis sativa]